MVRAHAGCLKQSDLKFDEDCIAAKSLQWRTSHNDALWKVPPWLGATDAELPRQRTGTRLELSKSKFGDEVV